MDLISENVIISETERLNVELTNFPKPFKWITIFVEIIVTSIMTFSVFYFVLEVNEITNYHDYKRNKIINNSTEVIYLVIAVIAIILHIIRYIKDVNAFYDVDFDNYPMLIIMISCASIDVMYYFLNFALIFMNKIEPSRIIATISEVIFAVSILPFVIICVCNNVRPTEFILEMKTKITILVAMGGCLVIYMRRVTLKVEKDYFNINLNSLNETNSNFIHRKIYYVENFFELLDIIYVLTCLIFLIDPLRIASKLKHGNEDINLETTINYPKIKFLQRISFVKYRTLTAAFSVIVVGLSIIASYIITEILGSNRNDIINESKIVFFICNIIIYICGIIFGVYYYYSDICHWDRKESFNIRNDKNFNNFSVTFQIFYAGGMILSFIYINQEDIILTYIEILNFILMATQIIIQSGCINSAIKRESKQNPQNSWQSVVFPSLALASINFFFMIISIVYSKNAIFTEYLKSNQSTIFYVIKDIALPVTVLNRLHGMVFFINLSIQQWDN